MPAERRWIVGGNSAIRKVLARGGRIAEESNALQSEALAPRRGMIPPRPRTSGSPVAVRDVGADLGRPGVPPALAPRQAGSSVAEGKPVSKRLAARARGRPVRTRALRAHPEGASTHRVTSIDEIALIGMRLSTTGQLLPR